MAPDHKLREDPHIYAHLMDMIETIMGGPVFISDESTIWDFPEGFREKLEAELGFPVAEGEYLLSIVQRMKEMNNPQ